ncbi:MAG TPA: hypothetical protein VEA60_09130 [Allosphingosinicella sp.]|nr:hypothetical protein [Allosphingosinicella sp.]
MTASLGPSAPDVLRTNERLKAFSTVVTNLGAVLFATSVARGYAIGIDPPAFLWFVMSVMVIWSGIHVLTALEPEQADG